MSKWLKKWEKIFSKSRKYPYYFNDRCGKHAHKKLWNCSDGKVPFEILISREIDLNRRTGKSFKQRNPNFKYMFWILLDTEFQNAGRTDSQLCMKDLMLGNYSRFIREFGVYPIYINEYKSIIRNKSLTDGESEILSQIFFRELLNQMIVERNWKVDCFDLVEGIKE